MKCPSYPSYKPSGVEWLGDVPEHWVVTKVKLLEGNDQSVVQTGPFGAQLHASDYVDEGIPLILIRNVNDFKIDDTEIPKIPEEDANRLAMYRLQIDDLVFSRVGSIGRIARCTEKEDGWLISGQMLRLRLRNPQINKRYALYILGSEAGLTFVELQSVGSTRESINTDILRNIPILIPPLPEQRAIANFLDCETTKIDTLIAKRRALIEKLKEKRSALISRTVTRGLPPAAALAAGLDPHPAFKPSGVEWLGDVPAEWEVTKLGYLTSKVGSGKTPKGGAETYQSEGVMLIRSQNVYNSGLRLSDVVYIDESVDEDMANTRVVPRDILLNITGASLGRCAIAPLNLPQANVNQHVCIVRLQLSKTLPEFIQCAMTSLAVQSQIFSFENGSSREGLNFHQVRNLILALPPLPEQRAIADFLDRETAKIDRLVSLEEAVIDRMQEYRSTLITAAVTGKIDVRRTEA